MTYIYVIQDHGDEVLGATTDQAAAYERAIAWDESIGIFPDALPASPTDGSVGWYGLERGGRTYFSKDGHVHMPESALGTLVLLDVHDGERSKYYDGDAAIRKARELIYLERGGIS